MLHIYMNNIQYMFMHFNVYILLEIEIRHVLSGAYEVLHLVKKGLLVVGYLIPLLFSQINMLLLLAV